MTRALFPFLRLLSALPAQEKAPETRFSDKVFMETHYGCKLGDWQKVFAR